MKFEKEILQCLFENNRKMNSNEIAEIIKVDSNATLIGKDLYVLSRNKGFVISIDKLHMLSDKGRNHCVITYGMSDDDIIKELPEAEINDIDLAFDKLRSKMGETEIENLDVKLSVLTRLSDFMDDSISKILDSIIIDLGM